MQKILSFLFVILPFWGIAQSYTSYFTGDTADAMTTPLGGICLMGGATEDDNAMRWFLQRANGGDVLVLRASGSNGYNNYLYSTLGVTVNSVETIVCNTPSASIEPYVLQQINQAEAIWFAGGDQWNYVSYWRGTPFHFAVNQAIQQRGIVVGGTSAGMAIQGQYYFSAENGTVTSATALANPFNPLVTVDSTAFLANDHLVNTITDTHFDNPDRRGRMVAFLARIQASYGSYARGIACEEFTAVCIDTNGIAHVFGGYPTYDDNAYFIQSNCALTDPSPETCMPGNPLTWDRGGEALKVYRIAGDSAGTYTFDLNTWETGTGGTWLDWSAVNGVFSEQGGTALNCAPVGLPQEGGADGLLVYPNPTTGMVTAVVNAELSEHAELCLYNTIGKQVNASQTRLGNRIEVDMTALAAGVYILRLRDGDVVMWQRVVRE